MERRFQSNPPTSGFSHGEMSFTADENGVFTLPLDSVPLALFANHGIKLTMLPDEGEVIERPKSDDVAADLDKAREDNDALTRQIDALTTKVGEMQAALAAEAAKVAEIEAAKAAEVEALVSAKVAEFQAAFAAKAAETPPDAAPAETENAPATKTTTTTKRTVAKA